MWRETDRRPCVRLTDGRTIRWKMKKQQNTRPRGRVPEPTKLRWNMCRCCRRRRRRSRSNANYSKQRPRRAVTRPQQHLFALTRRFRPSVRRRHRQKGVPREPLRLLPRNNLKYALSSIPGSALTSRRIPSFLTSKHLYTCAQKQQPSK